MRRYQNIRDESETMQHLYDTIFMFNTKRTNQNSDITTGKMYLIRLFISNLMYTVKNHCNENIQPPLSCYGIFHYNSYF